MYIPNKIKVRGITYVKVADLPSIEQQEVLLYEVPSGQLLYRKDQIALLKRSVQAWNEWRETVDVKPDLRKIIWSHANLQSINLQGADLRRATLRDVNLRSADLQDANLQGADLRSAIFQGAHLQGADLRHAKLWDANFQRANLTGANLQDANLWSANLKGANLHGTYADNNTIWPKDFDYMAAGVELVED